MFLFAQSQSSASEKLPTTYSDILLSSGPSFGFETSFTVLSYPESTRFTADQHLVSSLSADNTAGLSRDSIEENSRAPTLDRYHYSLLVDNQLFNSPG